jgi:hypothetical protein
MEKIMKYSKFDKTVSWIVWAAFIALIALAVMKDAKANTQNNESGSNTLISGGMTTTTNNDYSGAASVDNSTTSNSTSNVRSSVPTASAPGLSSGIDTCSLSVSAGVQTFNFGISGGSTYNDEKCEMRKNAKLLSDLGMKVASLALICKDPKIFSAMFAAETYCPINIGGKSLIGEKALAVYTRYPRIRPDYEDWKRQQDIIQEYKDNEEQFSTGR